MDSTHVKARANNKKMQKRIAQEEALFFEDLLKKEINEDREAHGKRPLKEKDDDNNPPSGPSSGKEEKTIKTSTSDPESGWFHKGEHKSVFAYAVQTACDKNGWILGYSVHPGNHHDSRSFKFLYDKIKEIGIRTLIADAGYKTPGIAKLLIDDGIKPLLPYRCPMTKKGSSRNMSTFMMSIMIAISVQTIRYCPTVQPTVMDIVNIRAAEWSAKTVHTWRSVPKAGIM